ncbi:hypothetical protein [Pseudoruegeria sp. HB172150]|uniref:hypothetical protein n=1 Tax=Pseudoruegeria sp. HB172150 TaxID=2721164 RepID=UPI001552373B|nr:hypothetical protein [Pseudoruegeria sp. HB172150]
MHKYAWMPKEAIKDRPDDMVIGMHVYRGSFRSSHFAEGGYHIAANAIFNMTSVDDYLMEYDTERVDGLQPLARLPNGENW